MSSTVVQPPANPSRLAEFEAIVAQASPTPSIRSAFANAIRALANGSAVRIEPVPTLLSTTQAADLLGISRTTLVKLLEEGKLPYDRPNVHRLIRLDDVLAYKERRSSKRQEFLDQLIQESVADESFFITAEEADAALERAKKSR